MAIIYILKILKIIKNLLIKIRSATLFLMYFKHFKAKLNLFLIVQEDILMKSISKIIGCFFSVFCIMFLTNNIADAQDNGYFDESTPYSVCFTPGDECIGLIVDNINKAKKTVLVQAYSFTAAPIAKALVNAKKSQPWCSQKFI